MTAAEAVEKGRRDMTKDIGFIGLGRMGGPMARNLAAAGYSLHVYDIDVAASHGW